MDKDAPWHKQKSPTSTLKADQQPRRNTHDSPYFFTPDGARGSLSRNNSDASINSLNSEPPRRNTYTPSTTRRRSVSPKAIDQTKGDMGGWKALFGSDKASKQEKKDKKKKEVDKIVLTSRHAAVVKTKMQMDPKFAEQRRASEDRLPQSEEEGGGTTVHLSPQQQEMRFPHSGPPSTHSHHKRGKADMPELTRIVSGDENDEEEERVRIGREEWLSRQSSGVMKQVIERKESETGEIEEIVHEVPEHSIEETADGVRLILADLNDEKYQPRQYKNKAGLGAGWGKADNRNWTRPGATPRGTPKATPTGTPATSP